MLHYVMNTTPENNKINMRTTTHKNNKQKQKPEMCKPFGFTTMLHYVMNTTTLSRLIQSKNKNENHNQPKSETELAK